MIVGFCPGRAAREAPGDRRSGLEQARHPGGGLPFFFGSPPSCRRRLWRPSRSPCAGWRRPRHRRSRSPGWRRNLARDSTGPGSLRRRGARSSPCTRNNGRPDPLAGCRPWPVPGASRATGSGSSPVFPSPGRALPGGVLAGPPPRRRAGCAAGGFPFRASLGCRSHHHGDARLSQRGRAARKSAQVLSPVLRPHERRRRLRAHPRARRQRP